MKTKLFFLIICFGFLLPYTCNWVEAKNNNSSKLINIYKDELSASERELFKETEIGAEAYYRDQMRSERTIRADRIVWLCTDRHASEIITYRGIQIRGAYIDGNLDLRYAKIPFPLCFVDCNFSMEINLEYANVLALDLSGSTTNKIIANGLEVYYSLFLNNKFRSRHKVSLDGAKIGGILIVEALPLMIPMRP